MDCPPGVEVKAIVSPSTADEGEGSGVGVVGLYATRNFSPGEVVLDEIPFFVADGRGGEPSEGDGDDDEAASTEKACYAASSQFDVSDLDEACSSYFGDDGARKHRGGSSSSSSSSSLTVEKKSDMSSTTIDDGGSRLADLTAMIRAAASFAALEDEADRRHVLDLYHPDPSNPLPTEVDVIRVARDALRFCKDRARHGSRLHRLLSSSSTGGDGGVQSGEDRLLRAMLVWSCNAFEGGLLYGMTSRVNHSCDPNCHYGPPLEPSSTPSSLSSSKDHPGEVGEHKHRQVVRALVPIEACEEITVSYLGVFTWTDGGTRRRRLAATKHFECGCSRCRFGSGPGPGPGGKKDDGKGDGSMVVDVASAVPCPSCHPRRIGGVLEDEVTWEEVTVSYAYSTPGGAHGEEVMKCSKCNFVVTPDSREARLAGRVMARVTDRLSSSSSPSRSSSAGGVTSTHGGKSTSPEGVGSDDAFSAADAEIDEQLYKMAASVVGARHWTTNLMLLSILDRSVGRYNADMILGRTPPLEDLADSIDSLQRLWKYAEGLSLRMDPAFLLHRQTLGVARSLVALGDVKSQRYGSEWVERICPYVERFEGEGVGKVVHALRDAWKRRNGRGGGNDGEIAGEDEGDCVGDTHETKKRRT